MAKVEIEIGDDGKFGTLPEPLQKFVDRLHDDAFKKGAQKAAEAAAAEIEVLRKTAGGDPVAREKLKAAELELSQLREAQALRDKNYEAAQKERDDRAAKALAERDEKLTASQAEIQRRDARIRDLVRKEIGVVAAQAGARPESLKELEILLDGEIGLDDGFQPFVKDLKDPVKPRLGADGKPVTVEAFVAQYLTDHPHHKGGGLTRPAGAPGGRTLSATRSTGTDAALAALEANPNDRAALRQVWGAISDKARAQQ